MNSILINQNFMKVHDFMNKGLAPWLSGLSVAPASTVQGIGLIPAWAHKINHDDFFSTVLKFWYICV